MKKAVLIFLCLLALLNIGACGDGKRPSIDVYRPYKQQGSDIGFCLISEEVALEPGISPVSYIIGILNAEPKQADAARPLPAGINITAFEKYGKTLTLEVSGGFAGISGAQKALAEASIIMSFTDFSDIELVSIEESGKVIMKPRGRNSILFEDMSIILQK